MKLSELKQLLNDYADEGDDDPEIEVYDRHGDPIKNPRLETMFVMQGRKEFEKIIFHDSDEH